MTAKEKANELLDKFNLPTGLMSIERKQCALIAVEEILDNGFQFIDDSEFWKQVKQELLKL